MIEQVRYAWAAEGLAGRGKFQVTAATPGLTDPHAQVALLAARLFNYTPLAGRVDTPRAFGWLDAVGLRFAFNRAFLPEDQIGHPGNFAAHVLVGTPAELPARALLATFDSDFWWAGPKTNAFVGELPYPLLPQRRDADPGPPPEGTDGLLAALLTDEPVYETAAGPAALVDALTWVDANYPFLLEGLNVSTWETDDARIWFHICGTPGSPAAPAIDPSATALLERRLPVSRVAGIWRDLGETGGARRATLRAVLESVSAASSDSFTIDDLRSGLASPEGQYEVLCHASAQRCVGAALAARDLAVARALRAGFGLGADVWAGIADAMKHAFGAAPVPEACITLLPGGDAVDAITDAHLEELGQGRSDPIRWAPTVLYTALTRAPASGGRLRVLVDAAAAQGREDWLGAATISRAARAALYDGLVLRGRTPPLTVLIRAGDLVPDVLASHPEVLAAQLGSASVPEQRALTPRLLEEILACIRVRAVPAGVHHLLPPIFAAMSLSAEQGLDYLLRVRPAFADEPDAWAPLADSVIGDTLEPIRADTARCFPRQLDPVLEVLPEDSRWAPLRIVADGDPTPTDIRRAARAAPPSVAEMLTDVCISRGRARSWESMSALAEVLAGAAPGQATRHAMVFLRAASRAASAYEDVAAAADTFLFAAFHLLTPQVLEPGRTLLTGTRAAQHNGVADAARKVCAAISDSSPDRARWMAAVLNSEERVGRVRKLVAADLEAPRVSGRSHLRRH